MNTARLRLTGRVQGVGYRLWAVEIATALGLRGWVRNRTDGSVEMLLSGTQEAIAATIEACRRGPPGARVDDITVAEDTDDGTVGFAARPTV
jgi:acylphosphatase